MDEAGYGPNLGPLVVAATAWEVAEGGEVGARGAERGDGSSLRAARAEGPGATGARHSRGSSAVVQRMGARPERHAGEVDLYRLLRKIVARAADDRRIAIADSKALYRPGLGLRHLERGVHAVLGAMERSASCWSEAVALLRADPGGRRHSLYWHEGFDCALPVDAAADEVVQLGARLAEACLAAGVRPLAVRARLVFPAEFNEMVTLHGTKGAALSHATAELLREVVDAVQPTNDIHKTATDTDRQSIVTAPRGNRVGANPLFAVCDKHGGRNYYAALLQHHFSEHWIEAVFEGAGESRYEWGPREARTCVSFRMGGESFLPTALASMTAKYLRELAMRAFNEFWCARVSGLKPTAGYPLDARRFKAAIEAKQRELGIEDHVLWRSR